MFACLVATLLEFSTMKTTAIEKAWYLNDENGEHEPPPVVIAFLRYFVLLANFVSVSLYATIDLNKFVVARIIEHNKRMHHADSGEHPLRRMLECATLSDPRPQLATTRLRPACAPHTSGRDEVQGTHGGVG